MTVSDATRDEAWVLLCNLERNVRYFGALGDRYRVWYRSIRYFLLELLLAGLTVFDSVTNYAESSAQFRSAALMCGDLQAEASRLWRDISLDRTVGGHPVGF